MNSNIPVDISSCYGFSISETRGEYTIFLLFKDVDSGCKFLAEINRLSEGQISFNVSRSRSGQNYKVEISWGSSEEKSINKVFFIEKTPDFIAYLKKKDIQFKVKIATETNDKKILDAQCVPLFPVSVKYNDSFYNISKKTKTILIAIASTIFLGILTIIFVQHPFEQKAEIEKLNSEIADLWRLDSLGNVTYDVVYSNDIIDLYGDLNPPRKYKYQYANWNHGIANAYSAIGASKKNSPEEETYYKKAMYRYDLALNFFTISSNPIKYASIQINKGRLYIRRAEIRSTSENLDSAIVCYKNAMTCQESYPESIASELGQRDRITTLMNLAVLYRRKSHTDLSLKYNIKANDIIDKNKHVELWITLQKNIANTYIEIVDERGAIDTFYKALDYINTSLKYFTVNKAPEDYAAILENKATAYVTIADRSDTTNEWKAKMYDTSVSIYRDVLNILDYESAPFNKEIADVVQNFGMAYVSYSAICKDPVKRSELLNSGVGYLEKSLTFFKIKDYPVPYAVSKENLGNAHLLQADINNRKKNTLQAIKCYNEALTVYTKDEYPEEYTTLTSSISRLNKTIDSLKML